MVEAEGIKDKKKVNVKYQDGKFLWNGEEDELYSAEMKILMKTGLSVMGTYIPDEPDDVYVSGLLREYFFDSEKTTHFKHEIEGDWEKGMIY